MAKYCIRAIYHIDREPELSKQSQRDKDLSIRTNLLEIKDLEYGQSDRKIRHYRVGEDKKPWVICRFGVFLNRSFYSPLLCDQNKPLVMPNGQVLAKLWLKKFQKKNPFNLAYNPLILPTETKGKNPWV